MHLFKSIELNLQTLNNTLILQQMIHFFGNQNSKVFAVQATKELTAETISKLNWLFGNQPKINVASLDAFFIGPRAAMITPWSTNAVEISQNMGISDIIRIEEFEVSTEAFLEYDPMISEKYQGLNQESFTIEIQPEPILNIKDIAVAIDLIIKKNIKADKYVLRNEISYKMIDLINTFN